MYHSVTNVFQSIFSGKVHNYIMRLVVEVQKYGMPYNLYQSCLYACAALLDQIVKNPFWHLRPYLFEKSCSDPTDGLFCTITELM